MDDLTVANLKRLIADALEHAPIDDEVRAATSARLANAIATWLEPITIIEWGVCLDGTDEIVEQGDMTYINDAAQCRRRWRDDGHRIYSRTRTTFAEEVTEWTPASD